jgi:conjugal transfer pilus assembly protein TraL
MADHWDFIIARHLDRGRTLLGFPMDEMLPALALFFWLLSTRHLVWGLVLGLVWFIGLREIKQRWGAHALFLGLHRYAPGEWGRGVFPRTPAAHRRYWVF